MASVRPTAVKISKRRNWNPSLSERPIFECLERYRKITKIFKAFARTVGSLVLKFNFGFWAPCPYFCVSWWCVPACCWTIQLIVIRHPRAPQHSEHFSWHNFRVGGSQKNAKIEHESLPHHSAVAPWRSIDLARFDSRALPRAREEPASSRAVALCALLQTRGSRLGSSFVPMRGWEQHRRRLVWCRLLLGSMLLLLLRARLAEGGAASLMRRHVLQSGLRTTT